MSAVSTAQGSFWRKFTPLFAAGTAGVIALFPSTSTLIASQFERIPNPPPFPLPVVTALALMQPTLLLAGAVALGVVLAPRLRLHSRIIEKAVADQPLLPALRAELPLAATLGASGFALTMLAELAFRPLLGSAAQALSQAVPHMTISGVLLALLYGGVTEELLMRWGLMTLLVWIGWRTVQRGEGLPRPTIVWSAIVVAALLFGVGHLPATAVLVPITLPIVARAILLNGIVGVIFGWLYWRRSLEAAMLAHVAYHICATIVALVSMLG